MTLIPFRHGHRLHIPFDLEMIGQTKEIHYPQHSELYYVCNLPSSGEGRALTASKGDSTLSLLGPIHPLEHQVNYVENVTTHAKTLSASPR